MIRKLRKDNMLLWTAFVYKTDEKIPLAVGVLKQLREKENAKKLLKHWPIARVPSVFLVRQF